MDSVPEMISRVNVRKVNELTRVIGAADRDGFLELILHLDGHLVGAFATESLANGAISHLKHALIIAEETADGLTSLALLLRERQLEVGVRATVRAVRALCAAGTVRTRALDDRPDVVESISTAVDRVLNARPPTKAFVVERHGSIAVGELTAWDDAVRERLVARCAVAVGVDKVIRIIWRRIWCRSRCRS
jgi:hypothetical protein